MQLPHVLMVELLRANIVIGRMPVLHHRDLVRVVRTECQSLACLDEGLSLRVDVVHVPRRHDLRAIEVLLMLGLGGLLSFVLRRGALQLDLVRQCVVLAHALDHGRDALAVGRA